MKNTFMSNKNSTVQVQKHIQKSS